MTDCPDLAARLANLSPEKRRLLARRLEERGAASAAGAEPIAIVGLACRFPGAPSAEAFWKLVREGGDAVREVPPDRWDLTRLYDADASASGMVSTRWGGFLEDVAGFDAAFFGISPREAARMDPQQRLFLEVAWDALEDAGQTFSTLAGGSAGVFAGVHSHSNDYTWMQFADPSAIDPFTGTGTSHNYVSGRLSYFLDLHGPSVTVDTACSSSLVAVHLACQSLRVDECSLAIVGGVNLMLTPHFTIAASRMHMLSPDGRCMAFDARANGFVRAEGCGVVVLRRLSEALAAGDRVLAVIRGSAVNQDGRTNGATAPNGEAQRALVQQALRAGGVDAGDVTYVEAHGTGTALGDPIEVEALAAVVGQAAPDPCALGSAKANIGHLEGGAGIASLIKVVLALRAAEIPPVAHFEHLNPHITIAGTRLEIPSALRPWTVSRGRRIAGVSSFGWSGTNAHVIVEEAPPVAPPETTTIAAPAVLPISASSAETLDVLVGRYADWLAAPSAPAWRDALFSAACRRTSLDHRLAVVAGSAVEAVERLRAHQAGAEDPHVVAGHAPADRRGVVFVFPGQGAQWLGMGRELIAAEPAFRAALERGDRVIADRTGWSVIAELQAEPDASRLARIDVVQPVLFALQVALAALWRSWGIEPDALVGHSMGEIAAAHVGGALTLDDAVRIVCERSRLMRGLSGRGAMAVVELSVSEAREALAGREDRLSIAVSNSPRSTVIAGDPEAIAEVLEQLRQRDVFCRPVNVDVASHSPQMDPIRPDLLVALAEVRPVAARVPIYSTVIDRVVRGPELDAAYWANNLREPVLFHASVSRLLASGHTVFVEISPHPILLPAIETTLREVGSQGSVVASLRRDESERGVLTESLARLYVAGCTPRWDVLQPAGRFVGVPPYPWQHEHFWVEAAAAVDRSWAASPQPDGHPMLGAIGEVATLPDVRMWPVILDARRDPFLIEHRVDDLPLLAASVMVSLLLAAAEQAMGCHARLVDLEFFRPLAIEASTRPELQITAERSGVGWTLVLSSREPGGSWTRVAQTRAVADDTIEMPVAGATIEAPSADARDLYRRLAQARVDLGPSLQVLATAAIDDGCAVARVSVPDSVRNATGRYGVHPIWLDAAFQAAALAAASGDAEPRLRLVRRVGSIRRMPTGGGDLAVLARRRSAGDAHIDVDLTDSLAGSFRFDDVELQTMPARAGGRAGVVDRAFHQVTWVPQPRRAVAAHTVQTRHASWLLIGDGDGTAAVLAAQLGKRGDRVIRARETSRVEAALVEAASQGDLRGVVDLRPSERSAGTGPGGAETLLQRVIDPVVAILDVVHRLAGAEWPVAPRLWIVTCGGVAASPLGRSALTQAAVWGFGRVLAEEHRELWGGLIDLDPAEDAGTSAARVGEEIRHAGTEDQVAFRGGQRLVARLVPWSSGDWPPSTAFREDGTYLITGGLGGVGLAVARWAASQGARHLVLIGRRGLDDSAGGTGGDPRREAIAAIEALECHVDVGAVDVADRSALTALLSARRAAGAPPVRGVFHCAAVVDDRLIAQLEVASLARVCRPKVAGAWLLHELLASEPVEQFVLFSSVGSILGQAGQASYAAANAFLDALAHVRRADGRPALSVNWGAWRGLGFAATEGGQNTIRALEAGGIESVDAEEACAALARLLRSDCVQMAVMPVDATRLAATERADRPILAELVTSARAAAVPAPGASAATLGAELEAAPVARRRQIAEQHVQRHLAAVLRIPFDKIDPGRPFGTLGLESLLAMELRNRVERATGLRLPTTAIWNHPTVRALAAHVAGRLGVALDGEAAPPTDAPAAPIEGTPAPADATSDEQALRALMEGR